MNDLSEIGNVDIIPALVDRACRDLAEARDIATVLEIRNYTEALREYGKRKDAAVEAVNACQQIVVLAERRIGRELIAAQQRGEIGSQSSGRPKSVGDGDTYTSLSNIGITRQQAHEYREMAGLDEDDVADVVATANREKRQASKSEFKRRAGKKVEAPPKKPDHLTQFSLWLKNGDELTNQFLDHRELLSLASRFNVNLDPAHVSRVVEFLAALEQALEADRAA